MKKLYKLTLCIALIGIHCLGMDAPQKSILSTRQPRTPAASKPLKEAKPLKEIAFMNVMGQITKIMRESIADPVITQQKINELLHNAHGDVLNLITEQLYNQLKLPIINQLVQFPLITIPETQDYFVRSIEFDPSGNHCMVVKTHIKQDSEKEFIEIYTISDFQLKKTLPLFCDRACYSPQGKFMSASKKVEKEFKIMLFDIDNDFAPYEFDMQNKTVYSFNPQENHLITCNKAGIVKLLDIATQEEITADKINGDYFPDIKSVKNYIIALNVNKNNGKIKNITLVSEDNNQPQQHIIDVSMNEISSGYCQTALYPAKNLLALSSYSDLFIYNLETDQLLKEFSCKESINNIAFHPSGKFVAVASDDWTAQIWDIEKDNNESEGLILSVENSRHVVESVSFSPVTDLVLSSDGFIRLWDVSTRQPKLLYSVNERGGDESSIIICPNTEHGLLFTKNSAENIWLAPTSTLFNIQQLIWIYSAHWAKRSLKGEGLKLYLENLDNMIDTLFSKKDKSIKALLHKIVNSSQKLG